MKHLIAQNAYTFNATAKTVTFTSAVPASLAHILLVVNVTRGVLYFFPQRGSTYGGTWASPVLTLAASTTGHADGDVLSIYYDDGAASLAVSGTFWQATQPVSIAAAVAVTGTFWQATQPVSIASMPTTAVTGTFWQATQPVSVSALPLPDGAATAAKQPAIGTAGNSSTDVLSIQGIAGAIAVKVDGSAVTQPVSIASMPTTPVTGTFWQATQPVSIAAAVAVTGTFWQATQPVSIASMPTTAVTGTFWQATQPVSGTVTAEVATRTTKFAYASSAALTITLNSLTSSATGARESTVVDNSSTGALDALVTVIAALASGSPANDQCLYVYAFGSEDGTNFSDNVAGTGDAAVTLRAPTNLRLIGTIQTPASGGLTYKSHPMSVAAAFGGIMPRKWGIVVRNYTGLALAGSGCSASYSAISLTNG